MCILCGRAADGIDFTYTNHARQRHGLFPSGLNLNEAKKNVNGSHNPHYSLFRTYLLLRRERGFGFASLLTAEVVSSRDRNIADTSSSLITNRTKHL